MVGGYNIIKNCDSVSQLGFMQPGNPTLPIFQELEKEISLVATVGNVPNLTRYEMSISAGHPVSNTYLNHFASKMSDIGDKMRGFAAVFQ